MRAQTYNFMKRNRTLLKDSGIKSRQAPVHELSCVLSCELCVIIISSTNKVMHC